MNNINFPTLFAALIADTAARGFLRISISVPEEKTGGPKGQTVWRFAASKASVLLCLHWCTLYYSVARPTPVSVLL